LTSLAEDAERTRKMVAQQKGPVLLVGHSYGGAVVIPPFLAGLCSRIHAAIFNFCAGVMPPMPILGRSLL
jgi:pimeloyl-ACP methyl ester carboxylesterase